MSQSIEKLAELTLRSIASMTNLKPSGVVGIKKGEEGWIVRIELIEKISIPPSMDILGLYEVIVDEDGNILGFERKKLRHRTDIQEEE